MRYLTVEQVLFVHSRLIDETGGVRGVRDIRLLESAVARPKSTFGRRSLHQGLFRKAAALMEALMRNHPFLDGNKRTAMAAGALLLRMNGYELLVSHEELEHMAVRPVAKQVTLPSLDTWLRAHSRPLH